MKGKHVQNQGTNKAPRVQQAQKEYNEAPQATGEEVIAKGPKYRVALIVVSVLLAIVAIVYGAGVAYFSSHFYPETTIGSMDISNKSTTEVSELIAQYSNDFTVVVTGLGFDLTVTPKDADMSSDSDAIAKAAVQEETAWLWPYYLTLPSHDVTECLDATVNNGMLGAYITKAVDDFNKTATPPTNATAVYNKSRNEFVVESEKRGTQIDPKQVIDKVARAITSFETDVHLDSKDLLTADIVASDPRFNDALASANTFLKCDLEITVNSRVIDHIDSDLVSKWIVFDEELNVSLDSESLNAWVDSINTLLNTVGTKRVYTRPDGKSVTISGGAYGWSADTSGLLSQVEDAVAHGTTGSYDIPYYQLGNGFNIDAMIDWGAYCDVDLSEQHARYFDATGALVWESDVVTGTGNSGDATPTGVHMVTLKKQNEILRGPLQEVEVPDPTEEDPDHVKKEMKPKWESKVAYWIPFIGNAYGLHDATWQSAFGGTRYLDGFGSHGCVNLPLDKAAELYNIIQVGDPVIVHW